GGEIGTGGDHEDLPYPGMRDEDLGPVQDVVVAPVDRRGLGAAGVRAGARLRQAESAQDLARREQRTVAPLLLVRPEVHDRGGAERGVGADGDRVARVHLRELVDDDDVGEVIHPRPTELLRPGDAEQAQVGHLLDVVPGESAFEIVPPGARPYNLLREVAHQVAHLVVLLGEVEGRVHGGEYSRTLTSHVARYMSHAAPFRAACNV